VGEEDDSAMISSIVEVETYDSAQKFMDVLSPRSARWYPRFDEWIFRGQRDARWKLIPSAFRKEAWVPFDRLAGFLSFSNYANAGQLQFEIHVVRWFAQAADRQGLPVPGFDHTWMRERSPLFEEISRKDQHGTLTIKKFKFERPSPDIFSDKAFFPPPELRPLFGMAQHYGIPTRLLDWSESGYIAAYFAASGAAKLLKDNGKDICDYLTVWSLDEDALRSVSSSSGERIVTVRAPWNSNPNLRAQKGLFTLHETILAANEKPIIVPLEEALERLVNEGPSRSIEARNKPILYCLRLRIDKSPLLLYLLNEEGVSAASVFPGYAGVVQSAQEFSLYAASNYRDLDLSE